MHWKYRENSPTCAKLTARGKFMLEKLTVIQIKKFSALFGTEHL